RTDDAFDVSSLPRRTRSAEDFVILEERPPRLGWWFGASDHVFGNRSLRDLNVQLHQLVVDPGCAPDRVLSGSWLRIKSRICLGTGGRPAFPCRTFQVQYQRNP